jgi:hypothetical protein
MPTPRLGHSAGIRAGLNWRIAAASPAGSDRFLHNFRLKGEFSIGLRKRQECRKRPGIAKGGRWDFPRSGDSGAHQRDIGWEAWTRTRIARSRVWSPTNWTTSQPMGEALQAEPHGGATSNHCNLSRVKRLSSLRQPNLQCCIFRSGLSGRARHRKCCGTFLARDTVPTLYWRRPCLFSSVPASRNPMCERTRVAQARGAKNPSVSDSHQSKL